MTDPALFLPEPEPREVLRTVISVDDHVVEPIDTFEGRVPAKLSDRAPRIVETPEGHQVWEFEGSHYTQVGMNAVAGRRPDTFGLEPFPLRPDASRLLRRRSSGPRHGHKRCMGICEFSFTDNRILRTGLLHGR